MAQMDGMVELLYRKFLKAYPEVKGLIKRDVRTVVERFEHACLDSKADREALIKALVEALS